MWQPTAPLSNLHLRARFMRELRLFFERRDCLEVETPILSKSGGTDPNIDLLRTDEGWLASSPEFPLKRLLCAGSGDVYSLQKVFRKGECGHKHNPEFTMLEWYRVGWSYEQLMDEVEALCKELLHMPVAIRKSYQQLFLEHVGLNPFEADTQVIAEMGSKCSGLEIDQLDRDGWLDVIFSFKIEPTLVDPVFIYDFPASQAALAKIESVDGRLVARRFELVWNAIELANGYQELTDADEQHARFVADNHCRKDANLPEITIDQQLVAAMRSGMPECAGVAMGVDRLVMLRLQANNIADVIAFPFDRT